MGNLSEREVQIKAYIYCTNFVVVLNPHLQTQIWSQSLQSKGQEILQYAAMCSLTVNFRTVISVCEATEIQCTRKFLILFSLLSCHMHISEKQSSGCLFAFFVELKGKNVANDVIPPHLVIPWMKLSLGRGQPTHLLVQLVVLKL